MKKRKRTTGQARKKLKPWRYEKEMEFLLPCFEKRFQLTNIQSHSDSAEEESEQPESRESVGEEEVMSSALSPRSIHSQQSEAISCGPASSITKSKKKNKKKYSCLKH